MKYKNNNIINMRFGLPIFLILTLLLLNSFTVFAAPKQKIVKNISFKTHEKPFKNDQIPKEITEDGYVYKLKETKYTENSSKNPISTTKSYTGLSSKSVPNEITINQDGKEIKLKLKGEPQYKEKKSGEKSKTLTKSMSYNNKPESFNPPASITDNGTTYRLSNNQRTPIKNSQSYTGTLGGNTEKYIVINGHKIYLYQSSPKQGSWDKSYKSYFNLGFDVTDASWNSNMYRKGNEFFREINISGVSYTYNHNSTYTASVPSTEKTTYEAKANYQDIDKPEYEVTAYSTYEKANKVGKNGVVNNSKENNKRSIVIFSILLIFVILAVAFYLLYKEDTFKDIKREFQFRKKNSKIH